MVLSDTPTESSISLHDGLTFVDEQEPPAGDAATSSSNYAWRIQGPNGHVIGISSDTMLAPEVRDEDGYKLPGSTRVRAYKCDKQGNKLGDGLFYDGTLDEMDYKKFRSDRDYIRTTNRGVIIDEDEIVKIFVIAPDGYTMSQEQSRLTIGDSTADISNPVEVVDRDDLSAEERQAVEQANQL